MLSRPARRAEAKRERARRRRASLHPRAWLHGTAVVARRTLLRPHGARGAAPVSVLAVVAGLLVGSVALGALGPGAGATPHRSADSTPNAALEQQFASTAPPLELPAATAPPAPAPPELAAGPPLQSHEIFGFAPWWNIADEAAFDVKDMTTLAYFSLDVNPDGTIAQSGSGWNGYQSQALADLVTRAHAANDRVVLTATCFDQRTLDEVTSDPNAPAKLGAALVQLVSAKNLDGVNFDFEGRGSQDQRGLDNLIGKVTSQLRAANPHWQVTMSTYASSAGDPGGFYDIPTLNQVVDGFFVMAYDMDSPSSPSPTAPLTGPGNTDNVDLAEYASVVPRSKIILGVPYYGYDWPTSGPQQGATATGPASPVTYAQVAATKTPSYWDRASQTPWTSYQDGSQWHQVYFDDPTSLALKARLANAYRIAGVGVWALGMDGNDPAMLAALLGNAAPAKYAIGPNSTTTTQPGPPPQYSYSGVWNGAQQTLQPVNPSTLPGGGSNRTAGQLMSFATNDPRAACLQSGPPLPVYELTASPDTYVVQTQTPNYCASGTWEFTAPASSGSGSGGTTSTTAPGATPTTSPGLTIPGLSPSGSGGAPSTSTTAGPTATTSTTEPKSGGFLGL